ncbi:MULTISPECIES: sugar ABC transporter substrate-binding protein [Microbacterium]|uniref:sugar ABC transporter substrate-binding protein n=1 Tax=Microbacterium TaxID=33882 RepID=UPI0010388955|nr:sugar ABC transporter substrate-binding protein [Microbacterium sp. PI-1]TCJ21560.1 sugar ABC transporter substrate-binding protein [Microbacterium sp. PI-1]
MRSTTPTHTARAAVRAFAVGGIAAALLLAGCSSPGSGGTGAASSEEVPDVGVLHERTLPEVPETPAEPFKAAVFVAQQQQGDAISYTEALAAFGAEHGLDVDLYDAGGYSQIDKQINQIQTAITTDPDIMIVWATDPNAVVPALQQADAQGIKVLNWVQTTNFEGAISTIQTDFVQDSYNLTTAIGTMLGGEGQLVTAFGGCGGQYQRDLQKGAEDAVADMPGLSIAVSECPSDFDPTKVQDIVQNALVAQPDVGGVLTSVVSQAVGAVNAIQAAGATGEVLVGSGILTSCSDIELVESGQVPLVAGVPSAYMGELGAAVALRALSGLEVDAEYIVPSNIYTADNIGDADLTQDLTAQFLEGC